jgi:hypothetical protein
MPPEGIVRVLAPEIIKENKAKVEENINKKIIIEAAICRKSNGSV